MQFFQGTTSVNIIKSMYFANFHTHFRYAILFFGGDGESKKNFKLQKKVMRFISNVGRDTSCRVLFKTLNIFPLPCVYIMEIVYYIKMNIGLLEQNSFRYNYNTHHRSDLQSQFCRNYILFFFLSVNNMEIKLYNKLLNHFKKSRKYTTF
jgi:hypothetical protein